MKRVLFLYKVDNARLWPFLGCLSYRVLFVEPALQPQCLSPSGWLWHCLKLPVSAELKKHHQHKRLHFSTKNSMFWCKNFCILRYICWFFPREMCKWNGFFPIHQTIVLKKEKKQPNALSTNDPIFHNHWNWKLQLHSNCYLWQHRQTWHLLYYTNDVSLSHTHILSHILWWSCC